MYQYSIYFQLLILKGFQLIRAGIKRLIFKKNTKVSSEDLREVSERSSWWKALLLEAVIYLNYFVRYKIGRLLPKFGPQTIIYVAKKVAPVN
jgi:hypothetical protein